MSYFHPCLTCGGIIEPEEIFLLNYSSVPPGHDWELEGLPPHRTMLLTTSFWPFLCRLFSLFEMRPDGRFSVNSDLDDQPISRTYQYRKVMKPMLERKRRARINRCLDELKELMVTALQAEGENVSKLEKADILELTVSHLHKLKRQHALNLGPEPSYVDRFRAGFTQCAAEVSTYLATFPVAATVDPTSSAKLLQHLGSCIRTLETSASSKSEKLECTVPQFHYTPPSSPKIVHTVHQTTLIQSQSVDHSVWRPW